MLAIYFVWYNWARIHGNIRVTPAMEAGLCPDLRKKMQPLRRAWLKTME